jgi:hypothetical protein
MAKGRSEMIRKKHAQELIKTASNCEQQKRQITMTAYIDAHAQARQAAI